MGYTPASDKSNYSKIGDTSDDILIIIPLLLVMPCHIPSLLLIYYFPIPNCCFLHTFGHQKQVPCGDLSFSIFRYEFAQAFYLAWPSFESFLLVLVATIMRALTIIAIESVAWWLASLRSLNLAGESLRIEDFSWESHRGFSSKPGSPEAWSCGHSAFFDQKMWVRVRG